MTLLTDDTQLRPRQTATVIPAGPSRCHEPGLQARLAARTPLPAIMLNGADVRPSQVGPPILSTGTVRQAAGHAAGGAVGLLRILPGDPYRSPSRCLSGYS